MTKLSQKLLIWLGNSLDSVKSFSADAKREAGHQLGFVQDGREPADWKPMETVGAGVKEIRIHAETGYRVLYVAKFAEAVYVLHGFEKKTRRTPKGDIDLAKKRYRELLTERMKK
ncbi:MAG: type II toxin-antitoxin system RelE/ParE family toxin [Sulfuritalea sp.]|nr:type II toxin-antitoxin system RelE/ParE family toxin [Sulfuritalea sp.]MDP1981895.1 type II toxin-antitoxin system RelE/ParE family toxin [Sulfuritalea sp.]